jgi:hypothetical protein
MILKSYTSPVEDEEIFDTPSDARELLEMYYPEYTSSEKIARLNELELLFNCESSSPQMTIDFVISKFDLTDYRNEMNALRSELFSVSLLEYAKAYQLRHP